MHAHVGTAFAVLQDPNSLTAEDRAAQGRFDRPRRAAAQCCFRSGYQGSEKWQILNM